MEYEVVIGLEIHAELKTKTKMFCFSPNNSAERHPNINICPICMGHPGTLPTINSEAVKKVRLVGLALGGAVQKYAQFDRKNYFYPDLPKGYQISQYEHPFVRGGSLAINGRSIRIRRIHLEEDTGRLLHEGDATLVDFNRAGVPLMELVTEADLQSGEEARKFGEEFQLILRYLGASDADMEKGQMRLEANLSLRPKGSKEFGTKVELKNINSFKFAEDAVNYEIERQKEILEGGGEVKQETRGWNEAKKQTFSQRSKEEAHDYRYFPEPDLPPLEISGAEIDEMRFKLPELPAAKRERFAREYGLESAVVEILARERVLAEFYEETVSELAEYEKESPATARKDLRKLAAAFLTGELTALLNKASAPVNDTLIKPPKFAKLLNYFAEDKVSNLAAKGVLLEMFGTGEDPEVIINQKGLWQMSDAGDLEDIVRHIIRENPEPAADYRGGKEASLQFLVGQVMKESRGKANPKKVQEILKKILTEV